MKSRTLIFAAVSLLALSSLAGCATAPGTAPPSTPELSRVALDSVTSTAVSRVVTRDNASTEVQRARAERITAIALTLQGLGDDALSTLPLVVDALKPLLDKAGLTIPERQQADILVNALVSAALARVDLDKGNPTYATVRLMLDAVIRAASYYLQPAEAASTLYYVPPYAVPGYVLVSRTD